MRKIAIVFFTARAAMLAKKICTSLQSDKVTRYSTKAELCGADDEIIQITDGLQAWCGQQFIEADAIVFIGAAGIAVRTIAPFVQSKTSDPAVLVADEAGAHVVSLLSGHLGGGNRLTRELAACIGADPVITTASDVNEKTAIDVWAQDNDLMITDLKKAKAVAADIVAGKQVQLYCEGAVDGSVPEEFELVTEREQLDPDRWAVAVSVHTGWGDKVLHLIPPCVILGIGCRKERAYDGIRVRLTQVLANARVAEAGLCAMASIDLKAGEPGLLQLQSELAIPFETYTAQRLMEVPGIYEGSAFVRQTTGVDNVCERSAVAAWLDSVSINEKNDIASELADDEAGKKRTDHFLVHKTAEDGVTIALLEKVWRVHF